MNLIKKHMILFSTCTAILLTGCTSTQVAPEDGMPEDDVVVENENEIIYEDVILYETETFEFNLGEKIIAQSSGIDMPYELMGSISLPKNEENNPIVFILHGSHWIDDYNEDRYDLGFNYLAKDLAANGFMVVSFNSNAQYVLEHGEPIAYERLESIYTELLENLEQAISGEDVGFGYDLTNKGDLNNISFIGHSRGALGIDELIQYHEPDTVNAIIKVAVSNWIGIENPNPDIPTAIILPEFDGDARSLDGQGTFDELKEDTKRTSLTSLVFLEGAGHNFFNSIIEADDRELTHTPYEEFFLTQEDHMDFLAQYSVDFLNRTQGKNVKAELIDLDFQTPDTAYGYNIKSSLTTGDKLELLKTLDETSIDINSLGGSIISNNIDLNHLNKHYIPVEDEFPLFNHPGIPRDLGLLQISWNELGSSFTLEIPDTHKDFSSYDALSFYMAIDHTSELNVEGQNQSFSVSITDTTENSSNIILEEDTSALSWPKGEHTENVYSEYWSLSTPLTTHNIPLSSFEGIDLNNVASITLEFDQTDQGAIILRDIDLLVAP